MVPLSVLLAAANFYIHRDDLFIIDEDQKLRLVIHLRGLTEDSNMHSLCDRLLKDSDWIP